MNVHLLSCDVLITTLSTEQALTAKQIDAAPASTFVQLAASSARCVQLWRGRNESKVGIELLKVSTRRLIVKAIYGFGRFASSSSISVLGTIR